MIFPAYYTAATESGQAVMVTIEQRGLDRAILLNGVRMRSLYEPTTVLSEARSIVESRFGRICDWRAVSHER